MKQIMSVFFAALIVIIFFFSSGILYTIDETQQAVITQFGQPIGQPVTEAGLHMKMPFVQQVNYFDKRILEWDGEPNQIPTKDKKSSGDTILNSLTSDI